MIAENALFAQQLVVVRRQIKMLILSDGDRNIIDCIVILREGYHSRLLDEYMHVSFNDARRHQGIG